MISTVFVGAVEGSRVALETLIAAGRPPRLVVTLPPSAAARHSDFAALAPLARKAGIGVHETTAINAPETLEAIRAFRPDLALVIGWSQICGEGFRVIPRLGTVGFPPAPLPRLRGRAVIPWTIILGETSSASTLFWIDEGTDTGPILLQRRFDLGPDETSATLYARHVRNLVEMVPEAVEMVERGTAPRDEQDHARASVCARRRPSDGRIDWQAPAGEVERLVRALGGPYPPAFTEFDGTRVAVQRARIPANGPAYVGFPGQVQFRDGRTAFDVLCGDGRCLRVTKWSVDAPAGAHWVPPNHARFS